MDASAVSELGPTLGTTLGSLEMGVLFSGILFGVYALQVCNYFREYSHDPLWLKIVVTIMTILDTVHTAWTFRALWYYTIDIYGEIELLDNSYWTLGSSIFFSGTAVLMTQAFFSYRVWKVTQSRILGALCASLSLLRWGFSMGCAVVSVTAGTFGGIIAKYRWGVAITLGGGAAADVLIASALCMALVRARSPFAASAKMLDKIVSFTIGTGLLTSVIAIVEMICFLSMSNLIWVAGYVIIMKIFPICLLVSLNERPAMRTAEHHGMDFQASSGARISAGASQHRCRDVIELTTEISIVRDIDPARDDESDLPSQKNLKEGSIV